MQSAVKVLANQKIDAALVGKTAGSSTQAIFSAESPYTRNASLFLPTLNLTACPVLTNGSHTFGGALVTTDTMILANHVAGVSQTKRFIEANGTIHDRTVTAIQQIGTTDLCVAVLDSALPSQIKPLRVLSSDWATTVPDAGTHIAAVFIRQDMRLYVGDWLGADTPTQTQRMIHPDDTQRMNFFASVVDGDSGQAFMLVLDNDPILIGDWWESPGIVPDIAEFLTQINSAITSLGGTGSLTQENLQGYTRMNDFYNGGEDNDINNPNNFVGTVLPSPTDIFVLDNSLHAIQDTGNGLNFPGGDGGSPRVIVGLNLANDGSGLWAATGNSLSGAFNQLTINGDVTLAIDLTFSDDPLQVVSIDGGANTTTTFPQTIIISGQLSGKTAVVKGHTKINVTGGSGTILFNNLITNTVQSLQKIGTAFTGTIRVDGVAIGLSNSVLNTGVNIQLVNGGTLSGYTGGPPTSGAPVQSSLSLGMGLSL